MSRSRRTRALVLPALAALVLLAATACGQTLPGSAAAGKAPAAATPAPNAAFCTAIAQLGVQTRLAGSKPKIEAADYLAIADAYDKVIAAAPPELVPDLTTVARDYRMIGRGDTTLAKVGAEISKAGQGLTTATTKICVPGQK